VCGDDTQTLINIDAKCMKILWMVQFQVDILSMVEYDCKYMQSRCVYFNQGGECWADENNVLKSLTLPKIG